MAPQDQIETLTQRLDQLEALQPHDAVMLMSARHALTSARHGGAVVALLDGTIIWQGDYASLPQAPGVRNTDHNRVLYMLFQPCRVCYGYQLLGGFACIRYAAQHEQGGMVHEPHPPELSWHAMMDGGYFQPADCSEPLQRLALDIAELNVAT